MGNIKANTHHAYLNTEIIISSTSHIDDLTDQLTGKKYCIDKEPLVIHLCAGTHCLYSKSLNEKIVICIEDAIKLGGSNIKGKYVFDSNPWVFITTGDRIYISNVETHEEKVEYNISPDDIIPLSDVSGNSSEYFLFITKTDYAIYNVDKDEFVFKFNNHIFSNYHLVIYQQGESIIVYDYIDNRIVVEFNGMYSLGNKLYYVKDEELYSLNLENSYISNIKEVGRVDDKCYLYKNMFFRLETDNVLQKIYHCYNLDDIDIKQLVFQLPYYIEGFNNSTKTKEYYAMDEFLNKYEEKSNELLKNHDEYDKEYRTYIEQFRTIFNTIQIDGLISKLQDDKQKNLLYGKMITYCKDKLYINKPIYKLSESSIVIESDKHSYQSWRIEEISEEDKVNEIKHSEYTDAKLSNSSGKKYITIGDNVTYHDDVADKSFTILSKLFDNSSYSNAFFTSDGKNVVFSKKNGVTADIMDFECMIQKPFDIEGSTLNHKTGFNGYKPDIIIQEADSRIPVWRDPITLKRIERNEMSNFEFKSPDGKYIAKNNFVTLFYDKIKKQYMNSEELNTLRKDYDFSDNDTDNDKNVKIYRRKIMIKEYESAIDLKKSIATIKDFTSLFVDCAQYILYKKQGCDTMKEIRIGKDILYLNYVSFSYDSKYLSFAAKRTNGGGVFGLYDIEAEKNIVHAADVIEINKRFKSLRAVWMTMFNKLGDVAYYDSCANAYLLKSENKYDKIEQIQGKSLLCFSPSGKYIAFSDQNYIPYSSTDIDNWGHQPSGNVFIHSVKNVTDCIQNFNDFASGIDGVANRAKTVASAAFSSDEKRFLAVGADGVIVIRNLYLN